MGYDITSVIERGTAAANETPLQPKSKRGMAFRSGPGATRTRDLLLRSAGLTASHRQQALILPRKRSLDADRRSLALVGYDTMIVTRFRLGIDRQRMVTVHSPAPPQPQPNANRRQPAPARLLLGVLLG